MEVMKAKEERCLWDTENDVFLWSGTPFEGDTVTLTAASGNASSSGANDVNTPGKQDPSNTREACQPRDLLLV